MSDVPYGAFLCGGVDSAAIVAGDGARRATSRRSTFTIGFPGHGDALDERAARGRDGPGCSAPATTRPRWSRPTSRPSSRAACAASRSRAASPRRPALLQLSALRRRSRSRSSSPARAPTSRSAATRATRPRPRCLLGARPRARLARPSVAAAARVPRNERLRRATPAARPRRGRSTGAAADLRDRPTPTRARAHRRPGAARPPPSGGRWPTASSPTSATPATRSTQALYLDTHLFLPDGLLIYGDKMSMAHASSSGSRSSTSS